MTDLTPAEQAVYDLRSTTNLTMVEIAERLDCSVGVVKGSWRRVQEKLKLSPASKQDNSRLLIENKDPEKAAAFLDLVTEPGFENLAEIARECGMPIGTAKNFISRVQGQYQPLASEADRIKTDVLVRGFESVASRAIDLLTDSKLEELDAYKLTLVAAIATDKRELLDGRPTERISVEDRRALPEIMALLVKEAEKRGLMPEVNPETQQVHLGYREDAPYQVRAGRERMDPIDAETR